MKAHEGSGSYWMLQPQSPTPDDEICKCQDAPPIILQDHLSPNPLACLKCNGEVPPQRIGFSAQIAEQLAAWRNVHRAFYTLWLDSAEYEDWAATQLENPNSPVNTRGLQLVIKLNNHCRTYYWWFQDVDRENFIPLSKCPRCATELIEAFGHSICENCSIVVSNG